MNRVLTMGGMGRTARGMVIYRILLGWFGIEFADFKKRATFPWFEVALLGNK